MVKSVKSWSGRRDSNPRPRPWQGCVQSFGASRSRTSRRPPAGMRPGEFLDLLTAGSRNAENLRMSVLMRLQVAQINHRTKNEHLATILLPNPVAAHDTSRHAMDDVIKISKENRILWNRPLRAEMGNAAFRVRCIYKMSTILNDTFCTSLAPVRETTCWLRALNLHPNFSMICECRA
jgi:hypothetical protein